MLRIAGQSPRAVEHGKGAVRVLMDPDPGLDVVVTVPIGRDLQDPVAVANGIVVTDDPLLMDA